jgi:hypothetical protein
VWDQEKGVQAEFIKPSFLLFRFVVMQTIYFYEELNYVQILYRCIYACTLSHTIYCNLCVSIKFSKFNT